MQHIPVADGPDESKGRCDQIAYQFAGEVQPHSALVVIDEASGTISQASESIAEIVGRPAAEIVGQRTTCLSDLISLRRLSDLLRDARDSAPEIGPAITGHRGETFLSRVHKADGLVLIELEPLVHPGDLDDALVASLVPALVLSLAEAHTVEAAAAIAATLIRRHLGYDRCMVYRFDLDGHGEVVGEDRAPNTNESYLGLRFPARDIPTSVRTMYKQVAVRHTVDQRADGSPLVPLLDPRRDAHTDLTHVRSRSNTGACRTFYRNMGVRATLVLPLVIDNEVWGHIALHHREPRRASPVHDRAFEATARVFGETLARLELEERRNADRIAAEVHYAIANDDRDWDTFGTIIRSHLPRLRHIFSCDSIAFRLDDQFVAEGSALTEPQCEAIVAALTSHSGQTCATSSRLLHDFPRLRGFDEVFAGAMAVRVGSTWDDYFIVLRRESRSEVRWAGDPRPEASGSAADAPGLTPRSSFEAYLEHTIDSSRPWTSHNRRICQFLGLLLGLRLLHHRAEMSQRMQNAFFANISHEIRTPMTAILGFTDLLDDRKRTNETDGFVDNAIATIRSNATHLLAIINDVLDICKVESRRLEIEIREVDVLSLVHNCVELIRLKAEDKGLTVRLEGTTPVPDTVMSDSTRLRQIVLNLLGNATKFTESGEVVVRLGYDDASGELRVDVEDTGIGMTEDQLRVLRRFERFTQADVSTTRRFGGTGLGLSISHSLSSLLGGTLTVDSEEGVGSVFTLSVPARTTSDARMISPDQFSEHVRSQASEESDARARIAHEENALEGVRVLLVEDGPDNQRLIRFHLERAGAAVEVAENGRVGVEMLGGDPTQDTFDVVLMDMQMPEMDGYEATRWLRRHGHTVPVVALTAHAMADDEEKCLSAGCDRYMTKPINSQALIATIRESSDRRQAA